MTSEESPSNGSKVPFLAALGVFAVALAAVGVFTFTRGDGLSEEQRVGRAAVGQNDALQRQNWVDYLVYTCREVQGSEPQILAAHRDSVAKNGARFVDDVTNVRIDGDRATGTVTYHFENVPDAKRSTDLLFAREDGSWRVCSAYK